MTAPDADHKPAAASIPPEALAAGQRTLAAIVFTDTVGFSALMSENEDITLRLVARDLEHMKVTCEAFGGQVLKSTGDGLLMLFTSAVQAVACALEIQRDLQKRNLELPRNEQLRHRLGIHLGDVFQHGGDVMGDGVNVAARLQTEAVPGGICLSKTVYDVVHNRLPFYVNDLGERKLKNIGKVTAYQISPEENTGYGFRFGWYRWRSWFWRGFALVGLLLVMGLVYELGTTHQARMGHRVQAALPVNTATLPVTPIPQASAAASSTPAGLTEVSQTEFEMARFEYMRKFDFDGMLNWIQTHDWPEKGSEKLSAKCTKFDHLFDWAHQQLQRYSAANPLVFVSRYNRSFSFWPTAFGGLKMKSDSQLLTLSREQIPPLIMVGITSELIKRNGSPDSPENNQLSEELTLFIDYYHIVIPEKPAPATPENP